MRKVLLLAFTVSIMASAHAQWISDSTLNNPVIRSIVSGTAKTGLVGTGDGSGNLFLAWLETRTGETTTDIYVQKILSDGNIAFPETGIRLGGNADESNLSIVADGLGGVIIVAQDTRGGSSTPDIYAYRLSSSGQSLFPATGTALCTQVASQSVPAVEKISATEFVVVWRDNRDGKSFDLYANKFLISNGDKQWTDDLQIVSENLIQSNQRLAADGAGGFIVSWDDQRISTSQLNIYAQRVNANGDKLWGSGSPNSGLLVNQSGIYTNQRPALAADGTGGAMIAFVSNRTGNTDQNIYAQYITAAGDRWTNDLLVCGEAGNQEYPAVVKTGTNYVVVFTDLRNNATSKRDIYAQSINGNGQLNWPASGVPVIVAPETQPVSAPPASFALLADQAGNATIIWDDPRVSGNNNIYAQRLNAAGQQQWPQDGVPVCSAPLNQIGPVAAFSNTGKIIVAWRDGRSGTSNAEIYASEINTDGTLPLQLLSFEAAAQGNQVLTRWQTTEERNTQEFVVEKSANGSRFTAIGQVRAANTAGTNRYTFTDSRPLAGSSFYRLRSIDADGKYTYSQVVRVHFGGLAKPAISLAPNPASTMVKVQLSNFEGGRYQLRMLNASGASVMRQNTEIEKGLTVLSLQLSHLPAGSYWLQLMQDGKPVATPVRLQKQ